MKPIKIAESNRVYKAPPNWNHQSTECGDLHVRDVEGMLLSAWQPSPEEQKLIAEGKPIILHIFGHSHPAVSIGVARETMPQEIILNGR